MCSIKRIKRRIGERRTDSFILSFKSFWMIIDACHSSPNKNIPKVILSLPDKNINIEKI